MRISLNWLRELVAFNESAQTLAEKLTLAGFEVEDIEDRQTWADGVVVGKVLDCEKHPNADKLRVCQVDIGAESPSTIVCGAPNVAAGLFVPVATLGTYLPKVDLKIKPAKLRGVASAGMICSLAELGLTKDSEGIHSFDPTHGTFKVGDDVRPLLGLDDAILDLTSTANRADALSMVGIAREVAALTGAPLTLPKVPDLVLETSSQPASLSVTVADPSACMAYIATRLEGVTIAPSPEWLQRRLEAAGTRPISNVVDITNYILLTWGQPLHAFDADTLQAKGTPLTLGVRFANAQEALTTLDGQGRSLTSQNLIITANDHPVAIAGVMGGEETEVRATTTNIILEAALFSAISVRRSARAQGLRTEASTRYERGANEALLDIACRHAIALLQELTGGKPVEQQLVDHRTTFARSIELRLARVNQILGPLEQDLSKRPLSDNDSGQDASATQADDENEALGELSAQQVTEILESLSFTLKSTETEGVWQVEVPPHRYRDIEREIDLIEEIARLHGYDQFCDTLPAKTEPGYLPTDEIAIRKIREAFRANGLTELVHYTWSKPGTGGSRQIAVVNPLLIEFSALRTEMISGLLTAFQYNQEQGNGPLNGFELGRIFWREEEGLAEAAALAGIMSGKPIQGRWQAAKAGTELTWFEAKGLLERAFNSLGLTVEYQPDRQDERFHPGRTASLWLQGERLGRFGQVHPQLRQARDLPQDVYVFELNLDVLLDAIAQDQTLCPLYQPYSTFPAADRDLAFFVSTEVSVSEIERVMRKAAQAGGTSLLSSVELFDEYRGEHVPAGQRSLAFRLIYRATDRTLTDEEVNPVHQRVRDILEDKFQVSLRS
ncbi:MAG: phenylalanine--tRNA ligase subunit beta [Thermosynechococcaceae cyanobacterium MS004]|nr:phenylalanine--tRNA ligase subunit beta [Thermosynechococcaceae cyanobacterium MS004]